MAQTAPVADASKPSMAYLYGLMVPLTQYLNDRDSLISFGSMADRMDLGSARDWLKKIKEGLTKGDLGDLVEDALKMRLALMGRLPSDVRASADALVSAIIEYSSAAHQQQIPASPQYFSKYKPV